MDEFYEINNKNNEQPQSLTASETEETSPVYATNIRLKNILKANQTYKICLAAVRQNGSELKYVAQKFKDETMCRTAVMQTGHAFDFLPKEFKTREMAVIAFSTYKYANIDPSLKTDEFYNEAFAINAQAISGIPEYLITKEMCEVAVQQDGMLLEYVPKRYHSASIFLSALKQSEKAIRYIPKNRISKDLALSMYNQDKMNFRFIPQRFMTPKMCREAIQYDARLLWFVNPKYITEELLIDALNGYKKENRTPSKEVYEIYKNWPGEKSKLRRLFIECGAIKLNICKYNKNLKLFEIEFCAYQATERLEFSNFDEFYKYLGGYLKNADLSEYDFADLDKSKYDLSDAFIPAEKLMKMGAYDNTFYQNAIGRFTNVLSYKPFEKNENLPQNVTHDVQISSIRISDRKAQKIYYISDLHLSYKIEKRFGGAATKLEIHKYIDSIVSNIINNNNIEGSDLLFIAGDVSSSFEITKLFYEILSSKIKNTSSIVAVLGNHELWETSESASNSNERVDAIVDKYRDLFDCLGITFLQNELAILYSDGIYRITEEEILTMSPDRIQNVSAPIVLGGIGFSGYCITHNASTGLYRGAVTTLEEDILQTKKFERLHNRLKEMFGHHPMLVLTHTPTDNWSKGVCVPRWTYINGHTHQNKYSVSEYGGVYSDNQIGYTNSVFSLKYFDFDSTRDIFEDLGDGEYYISRKQYCDFNRHKGIAMQFNQDGQITMLKRNGFYMFFYKEDGNKKMYLLSGGKRTNIKIQDLNYYYDKMIQYSYAVSDIVSMYNSALKSIALFIKSIGGRGDIHGSIVDIDYYNHIFLDPQSGKIMPYYAETPWHRKFHKDIPTLLQNKCPVLYKNFNRLIASKKTELIPIDNPKNTINIASDSEIVSYSRRILALQKISDLGIIRVWDEDYMTPFENNEILPLVGEKSENLSRPQIDLRKKSTDR